MFAPASISISANIKFSTLGLLRHNAAMSAILYPIATNAERALAQPLGRAARASEANALARGAVEFVTQEVGPAFPSRAEPLAAYAGRLDNEDKGRFLQAADRYCTLREILEAGRSRKLRQAKPTMKDGHRWSAAPAAPATAWRLSISYWRIKGAEEIAAMAQARKARRTALTEPLDAAALRAMSRQPLAPMQPQQPLDIGLFEFRPPEAPHLIIPDE
jgi:hypothetical protein